VSVLEFRRITRANGLALSEEQLALLEAYVALLLEWNGKINLISRRDQENVWFAQILHSVSPWLFVDIARSLRVLDLGTGGGLPGIPLAILRPDLRLTLLDSIRKKADAVRQMAGALGLKNVDVVAGRAEEVGRQAAHRHSYDVVVARAVAKLSDLARWSRPLLKDGGGSRPAGSDDAARESEARVTDGLPGMFSGAVAGGAAGTHGVLPGRRPSERIRIGGPCLLTLKGGDLEGEVREAGIAGVKVRIVPLVFPGGEQIGLEEKKLLVVTYR